MSFDDAFAATDLRALYDAFGVDATVQRGAGPALPVRIIIDRGQKRIGEYGQVIGLVDVANFMLADWSPQQGDVVAWSDRMGVFSKPVETIADSDGLEAKAVLHG